MNMRFLFKNNPVLTKQGFPATELMKIMEKVEKRFIFLGLRMSC